MFDVVPKMATPTAHTHTHSKPRAEANIYSGKVILNQKTSDIFFHKSEKTRREPSAPESFYDPL